MNFPEETLDWRKRLSSGFALPVRQIVDPSTRSFRLRDGLTSYAKAVHVIKGSYLLPQGVSHNLSKCPTSLLGKSAVTRKKSLDNVDCFHLYFATPIARVSRMTTTFTSPG